MISKNEIKLITGLHQKKYRSKHGMFIAEGIKVIRELLEAGVPLKALYTTSTTQFDLATGLVREISEQELKKISQLKTPNTALALFEIPQSESVVPSGLIVALDDIRDPGNLGTIIRLCDWFGIEHLVCSRGTVDCYNSKVIQATMGSLARVNVAYTEIEDLIRTTDLPVFVADMDGENVYGATLPDKGILVMGNEANGLSENIRKLADRTLSIPRFGKLQKTESLNVATATAILLSEFKRGA
ncbi:RNA methyltransferase, TrmH family [Sinomicrobium oceani]|uniref:RNA methyltransferase, TrmH family n=1 Tax=Sinomicrobium oceani TaxID=1150368 RepID=A0A1K1PRW8_9FLAO|nr:RNA methyltransferase [Sinomicrobium oceani]SFW50305.1 RNA methyltransferase, TrmH family [Sinomicrobium oceani]